MDLAAEVDTSIDIIWDGTSGMSLRVEKEFELRWEVRLVDEIGRAHV